MTDRVRNDLERAPAVYAAAYAELRVPNAGAQVPRQEAMSGLSTMKPRVSGRTAPTSRMPAGDDYVLRGHVLSAARWLAVAHRDLDGIGPASWRPTRLLPTEDAPLHITHRVDVRTVTERGRTMIQPRIIERESRHARWDAPDIFARVPHPDEFTGACQGLRANIGYAQTKGALLELRNCAYAVGQMRRALEETGEWDVREVRRCEVAGCRARNHAKGLCRNHYDDLRRAS